MIRLGRTALAYARWLVAYGAYVWCNCGLRKFCFPCDRAVWWFHEAHCGFLTANRRPPVA